MHQLPEYTPLTEIQYLPPVSYFALAYHFPVMLVEQCENYQKRSLRNKCIIAGPNGLQSLSIPLAKGKNQQQNITEVKIANHQDWKKQHLSSLQTAYGKSPFYIHYIYKIKAVFDKDYEYLFELNIGLINQLFDLLKLPAVLAYTEQYKPLHEKHILDFRNCLAQPVIDYDNILTIKEVKYPQIFSDRMGFLPNLSILDLLFCMGPDSRQVLKNMIIVNNK